MPNNEFVIDGGPGGPGRMPVPVPAPQLPEQTGNVDLDEKTREVLLGLGNKVRRFAEEGMITAGKKVPDLTALFNETLGMMSILEPFIRGADGRYHSDGIDWPALANAIEHLHAKIGVWQNIFGTITTSVDMGRMLLASLHADIIESKELTKEDGTPLVKIEDPLIIQKFRLEYEAKNLKSMANAFPTQPADPQGPQGSGGTIRMC